MSYFQGAIDILGIVLIIGTILYAFYKSTSYLYSRQLFRNRYTLIIIPPSYIERRWLLRNGDTCGGEIISIKVLDKTGIEPPRTFYSLASAKKFMTEFRSKRPGTFN